MNTTVARPNYRTFHFENLDDRTRRLMLSELDYDLEQDQVYYSPRLTAAGRKDFEQLLRTAITRHDAGWLADRLRDHERIRVKMKRMTPAGEITARVPKNAAQTLAEGEFNRYYIRGLCLRAIADDIPWVFLYRGKQANQPRPGSDEREGVSMDARLLFDDIRINVGLDTALGLPAGPNSGMTVRLP